MSNPKTYCGTISYMAPEVTDLVQVDQGGSMFPACTLLCPCIFPAS